VPPGPPTRASSPSTSGPSPYAGRAGFGEVLLRGDTDFSLTGELDRWDADGVRFVLGSDARANLVKRAGQAHAEVYRDLVARTERQRTCLVYDGVR